jgi:hypothetical protein
MPGVVAIAAVVDIAAELSLLAAIIAVLMSAFCTKYCR